MNYIGLDAGSVSVKVVLLEGDGSLSARLYRRHKGNPLLVAFQLLEELLGPESLSTAAPESTLREYSLSVTGSAGKSIGSIFGTESCNEVVAHAYATRLLYPHIRTVIEIGGEDSKLILLDAAAAVARDFSMNSACAAGTGSFLDQQAERLRLTIEEFSELALASKHPPRIAGRCSVFAKSDMIHLQQIATPVEDIVAGLCFAVARNFKGAIARGRQIVPPVSFQGGVAANQGMLRAFHEVLALDDIEIPREFRFMGAIGAALRQRDSGKQNGFDLSRLKGYLSVKTPVATGYAPLVVDGDDFLCRHASGTQTGSGLSSGPGHVPAYLGIDIGSISTNLVVIDDECRLLAKRYLMTAGRPIEAVRQGLSEIRDELKDTAEIAGVATTGSGRYMIADYVGADIVKNEITAQATAAAFIDPSVDTIFEIGGQDSKYISLRDGVIVDFEMNKACAAGTGSFLEEQGDKLGISIKDEFARAAFESTNPCRLGERCTVFMENSLTANLQKGVGRNDLLSGLAYSIVQNYINRVVGKRQIGSKIFFQGGVAFNKSVVAAFEKYIGRDISVPPHHEVTGALGMALIARRHVNSLPTDRAPVGKEQDRIPTRFKGFGLSGRQYAVSSFACRGCSNVCEINRVAVEGEQGHLLYGGRCEKYDVRRQRARHDLPDLFAYRDDMLWRSHRRYAEVFSSAAAAARGTARRGRIGVPYVFYFHDYLPFWTTLLWELGFEVIVSPVTDRGVIDLGLEAVLAETCFPVKTAHGHIQHLLNEGVDAIFLPSFVDLAAEGGGFARAYACPYTQSLPYSAQVALRGARILSPVVDLGQGPRHLLREIVRVLRPFGVTGRQISRALKQARGEQDAFSMSIRTRGEEILARLSRRSIVIVGRAYNSFDRGMNLGIPEKLADLGVLSLPMDFLPLAPGRIQRDWPNMYWRAGQRILAAARVVRENPLLYPVYIGNFSCGPDSFILKFFEEELAGKPYLHLEVDAHTADAGAITRCEAYLDSIENYRGPSPNRQPLSRQTSSDLSGRIVYIPRMSDHAHVLARAFASCGMDAEVLPESTKTSVDVGKRFVSGKECYPCAVTTGDLASKVYSPGFDPSRAAFFMPSGGGPCRFGQYNVFHQLVLRECGIPEVPVFSPMQDENFYRHLGKVGRRFSMASWQGIMALELLQKCLHETRPYEVQQGAADALYAEYLRRICDTVGSPNGTMLSLLRNMRNDFAGLGAVRDRRPLIGIVGEIFVRSNRFSNEDLVRKIEALGGEAYLAPVEEWLYYVNAMGLRKALNKKDWSGIISLLVKRFFQKRIEHRYGRCFEGFLKNLHEPDTLGLLRKARPYIHSSFEGEAVLSIGKSIDLIRNGASGIVSAMPFGCMPGTIVSGLLRGLSADYDVPCLSIAYDGTESMTTEIQLEAFLDQARVFGERSGT